MIERNEQEIDVGQEVLDLAPDKMDIVIRHELAAEILDMAEDGEISSDEALLAVHVLFPRYRINS
ncbi:hypothetical protein A3D80_01975 [Candidatus Roizmanbacteria bacterium RIFCSPHIGHO2_02_FULL_40_13b]|uniref:Uncharacterized protein n=1 Tax=Candidatus Roizmanbacteria bacterium RIFCSPHIGHO2_01_FULL_39_24 TaxID=1802032 RepID=A0A1F7GLI5_9BACT|nr:MAG: hypothetical protein A2799_01335 [Candidatus Roizmanbacteria bacterium RIFCSPHIGHO2_01_FULL_39_24]OGK26895.1 MAG: hypothetical protein A3D80_01975 [Candidatus Roizmanbacteria bacterium RIFCSPHIGHO2_02_FULL_40_13b]OGK57432.1 MAG: hypothetical protein A3H83_01465 [Candidatus Roizmanbacteria bacterium RIFCSPLOWO2_02_FULL_39_8]